MPKRKLSDNDKTRVLITPGCVMPEPCRALQRLPQWADLQAIKAVYAEARRRNLAEGISSSMMRQSDLDPWEVDHIIPLQGYLVSGLHVHDNLQVIRRSANMIKDAQLEGLPY